MPSALSALARAIAASPGWETAPSSAIVADRSTRRLAIIGRFSAAERGTTSLQSLNLDSAIARLRRLSLPDIESACEDLAARLVAHFGAGEAGRARYVAIPRGGFTVLGMLATALGLDHDRLQPSRRDRRPLVIVDDCALSGARFRGFLRRHAKERTVVFATLASPPALRAAIEAAEPRVAACISAREIATQTPTPRDQKWRRQLLAANPDAYWYGRTEPIAFPWGEPDRLLWHPLERRTIAAWRLVPPELCLKNRAGEPRSKIPVQEIPSAKGPIRPAPEVVYVAIDQEVVIFNLKTGRSVVLDTVASDLWHALIRQGTLAGTTRELLQRYDAPQRRVRADVDDLVGTLESEGFLERRPATRPRATR